MENPSEKSVVTDQSVVALTWIMKDMQGELLDTLEEPVEFLIGGDDLLQSIEQALMGKHVGDSVEVHLEPEHAFGVYDEDKVYLEAHKWFPAELEEGMAFDGHALPAGCSTDMPRDALYVVTDIYPEHVVLDGNHPLAGIGLQLRIRIHGVREATLEEIGAGTSGTGFFRIEPGAQLMPGNDTLH